MPPIPDATAQLVDEKRRWAEATHRVQHRLEHGLHVRGISNQLCLLLLIVICSGLTVTAQIGTAFTPVVALQYVTLIAGLGLAMHGYRIGKQNSPRLPQIRQPRADRPLAPLLPSERRSLGRQLRGREPIANPACALIRALIQNAKRNNHAVLPSLIGFFLFLLSQSLFLGWPWPLLIAALPVFVLIMSTIERRRWRNVLISVEQER